LFDVLNDLTGAFDRFDANRRQNDAPFRALYERRFEYGFEFLDAGTQCGLGHVTRFGCPAEMTVIVKGYQVAQMAQGRQVHHRFF